MTCPHCGNSTTDDTRFCPSCGAPLKQTAYCPNCGAALPDGAPNCPNCGLPLTPGGASGYTGGFQTAPAPSAQPRSRLVAAVLALFFGAFALEDFYLEETSRAILHLVVSIFTGGFGGMIWGFVNAIRLLRRDITCDGRGIPLKDFDF